MSATVDIYKIRHFRSFADFRRSLVVGMRFQVINYVRPEASGEREVSRVQTNAFAYWFTDAKGKRSEGWCHYPTASLVVVDAERVSFLDGNGGTIWVYHSFEVAS